MNTTLTYKLKPFLWIKTRPITIQAQVIKLATLGKLLLLIAVLLSAFGLVYLKVLNRAQIRQLESIQQYQEQLYTRWTQLRKEHDVWASEIRVQAMAISVLGMKTPAPKDIIRLSQT